MRLLLNAQKRQNSLSLIILTIQREKIYNKQEVEELLDLAVDKDLLVLSDEVYECPYL